MPSRGEGKINQIRANCLPEGRGHRCPLFRKVFGPKNQSYYVNLLFLLGSLVDDSSRAISLRVCETNNSGANIMNQIYWINLVNSTIQDCIYYMAHSEKNPCCLQIKTRQIFIKLFFYCAIHYIADRIQTLCAMNHVQL